ncbi:uncharacterized protein JCM6883_005434 [Sporobolomyces salmoneus]|uniref:uncharacterized protein n=1 Tax=Sporobolomyces salmoneus TaxID=183962 RepID=UPI00317C15CF
MNSIQETFLNTYANLVLVWLEWCEKEGFGRRTFPFRSSSRLGSNRLAWWSIQFLLHSKTYNALGFWHNLHTEKFEISASIRRQILAGCTTLAPTAREDRRGVTIHDLLASFKAMGKENVEHPEQRPGNLAMKACALVLFWGMGRIKDGTVERQAVYEPYGKEKKNLGKKDIEEGRTPREFEKRLTFDPKFDSSGDSFTFYSGSDDKPPLVSFKIPHDKSKKKKGATLQLPQQIAIDPELYPVRACRDHILANKRRNLVAKEFRDSFNKILSDAARPKIHGHSFRIGGSNAYRLAGINPEFVKPAGRWQHSSTYQIYGRDPERLSRAHLSNVRTGNEVEESLVKLIPGGDDSDDGSDENVGVSSEEESV